MTARTVTVCGRSYPLRFSLRVIKRCCERYGSMEGLFAVFNGDGQQKSPEGGQQESQESGQQSSMAELVDALVWMLAALLDAGYRYARANGEAAEEPPDEETLLDVLTLAEIQRVVLGTISGDSQRTVEAESPDEETGRKNGEGAAETASSPPPGSSGTD